MKEILIIGGGFAGVTAAIYAVELGAQVTLISSDYSEHSQSVMALGGINAALNTKGQDDSIEEHFQDTMKSGCYINNAAAVKSLTENAPNIIQWLLNIGVDFSKDENNNVELRSFGGQKKMRTAYTSSRIGKQIMDSLIATCQKYENEKKVKRFVGLNFLSYVFNDSEECVGAIFLNKINRKLKAFSADATIMATGGPNGIFGKTTGSVINDGSASGLALLQGVKFSNLEMIQYHPTTIEFCDKRILITEAARGEGGRLYTIKNGKKWYFMEEWYPEMGALMPRDIVSCSIYKVCNIMNLGIDGKKQVYLDLTELSEKKISTELFEVAQICQKYLNIDVHNNPIPVYPGIHYFMGGILTDENHRTNIKGLYAIGECSSQYHGANRLGGNSILGAVHGGIIASETVMSENYTIPQKEMWCNKVLDKKFTEIKKWECNKTNIPISSVSILEMLKGIMNESMGIYREEMVMLKAIEHTNNLFVQCFDNRFSMDYYEWKSISARIILAKSMLLSALTRKESRGAHQRLDYVETNNEFFSKNTIVQYDRERGINIEFKA